MTVRFAGVALVVLAVTGMATAAAYVVRQVWPAVAANTVAMKSEARVPRPARPPGQPRRTVARVEPAPEPLPAPTAVSTKPIVPPSGSPAPVLAARRSRKPTPAQHPSAPPSPPEVRPTLAPPTEAPPPEYGSPAHALPTSTTGPEAFAMPVSPPIPPPSGDSTAPSPMRSDGVSQEASLLRQALFALRREHNPRRALALLDEYDHRFGHGALALEATSARAQALLKIGETARALSLLDRLPLANDGQTGELRVIRGELRSLSGRCQDALGDFDAVLRSPKAGKRDEIARALFGRASCRARTGDQAGAEQDRQRYLKEFPQGPAAKQLLSPP